MDYTQMSLGELSKITGKGRSTIQLWKKNGILQEKVQEIVEGVPTQDTTQPLTDLPKNKVEENCEWCKKVHEEESCNICHEKEPKISGCMHYDCWNKNKE
jgi:hypothetical protein